MSEGNDSDGTRTCVGCERTIPADRSVCPACGTLQPAVPGASHPTPAPMPRPGRGVGPSSGSVPIVSGAGTGQVPVVEAHMAKHGPSVLKIVLALVVLVALIGAAVAATLHFTQDDDRSAARAPETTKDRSSTTTSASRPKATADPRIAAVEGFCDAPRPTIRPSDIAPFVPGKGAVAYVEVPQPASATEVADHVVVQVSPTMGRPKLKLAQSIAFVSLAVCVEQSGTAPAGATCDFELTNPNDAGDRRRADLLETSYRARIYDIKTGKALITDTITTPVDVCPEFAYLDGPGVSNPLTADRVVAWIADHMPAGKPT